VAPPDGASQLTAQEASVAREAAVGLSTREVAEVLFLSPRTVEFHLSNVYRKLGIHGCAGRASRLGWLAEPSRLE
jgi:DNA-binding CsgD family transcriptional regulator